MHISHVHMQHVCYNCLYHTLIIVYVLELLIPLYLFWSSFNDQPYVYISIVYPTSYFLIYEDEEKEGKIR